MEKIVNLTLKETRTINGGGWGWDIGWVVGNTIAGNWLTPAGIYEATVDYYLQYGSE